MKRPAMSRLLHKRYRKLNAAFREMHQRFDPDTIHTFRVQVKKLKALLHLFAAAKNGRAVRKVPAKLQKIYLLAGRIRTHQLQAQAVEKDQQPNHAGAYISLLREHTHYLTELALRQSPTRHVFRHGARRLSSRLPKKLTRKDMHHFMTTSTLPLLASGAAFPEASLHDMRKQLKDLLYTLPVIRKYAPDYTTLSKADIQSFTGLIGDYLDAGVQVQLIHSDRQLQPPDGETAAAMHSLENKWVAERRELRRKIGEVLEGNAGKMNAGD